MRRAIFIVLIISILLFPACNSARESGDLIKEDKILVYTSFYTLFDFASKIGGEHVHVVNIIPPGGDPHHWEPTASDLSNLEKAHVFIYNGLGLEHWVESVLQAIENEDLLVIQASQGVDTLESTHSHEDEDHDHGEEDPHIWLDPNMAKRMFENIKNALVEVDPDRQEYYEDNYKKYVAELETLDSEYEEKLSNISNRDLIVSHEAFTYLSQAYHLNQVGIQGLVPDSEPSPSRMAEIIDYIKEKEIKTIFFEDENDTKVVETISKETEANIQVLYTLEYLTYEQVSNEDDYFSVMRANLESLVSGLE